ncbi:hypothetical protein PV721_21130 [Streptomyces sp. MB09-01]|uniref:hypothetical protein n=1 Tax=Streptomyces sp. MB09-01 TaxID=3028666 RepID=UPI0029B1BB3B|nr:hypothetical protein [Streptomyces sp. MB09-01]MDX3536833.1 hypothetical protein [Streptomyces sp. MB09-01]
MNRTARIALAKGLYDPSCDVFAVESCSEIEVGDGLVYLPTAEHQSTGSSAFNRTNGIVSFKTD